MRLLEVLVLISSISFLAYGIAYFTSPKMKSEFIRFGLSRLGMLTILLEILGALGLMVGLMFNYILLISSGGLALLMFLGVVVRLRVKDGLWALLPALFFLGLNSYIFFLSMKIFPD
ncbi:MAG: DoxX family protein [bacterium]|nr:DoxX family protein [bacterium]